MTSWDSSDIHLYDFIDGNVSGKKLCYIKEICDINNYPNADDELKEHLANFIMDAPRAQEMKSRYDRNNILTKDEADAKFKKIQLKGLENGNKNKFKSNRKEIYKNILYGRRR